MLFKTLRIKRIGRRTWLHEPSGNYGPPAMTLIANNILSAAH